jgi:GT2 family glycosyltransferase
MDKKPKILVAAPIFDGMEYCIDEFVNRIKSLNYDGHDILLVDNSKTSSFSEKIREKFGVNVVYFPLNVPNMEKIIQTRNKILAHALDKSYDYILMMDCDVIPPVNIIEKLLSHKKDIVSGLYYGLFGPTGKQKNETVAWKLASDEELAEIKKRFPDFIKKHGVPRRHLTKEEVDGGELQEVIIPSAGCMLLDKKVFEKIRYGLLDVSGYNTSDDIFFCKRAREAGFKIYCDPSVKCEHLIFGKFRKDGDSLVHPAYD